MMNSGDEAAACGHGRRRRRLHPFSDDEGRLLAHPPGGARRLQIEAARARARRPNPIHTTPQSTSGDGNSLPVCHCFLLLSYFLTRDDDDTSIVIHLDYWAHRSFYQQRLVLSLDVQEIL